MTRKASSNPLSMVPWFNAWPHYLAGWLRRVALLRWRYPPRSRMWPRGWGEVIVAGYWILASTHHPWTWWWHSSGTKQRDPDCLNDLFLWIELSLLPGHFLICSFFHFMHCLHKHFSLHLLLFVKWETDRFQCFMYPAAVTMYLRYPNLLRCLRLIRCLSLLCSHALPSHSFCWNARNSCSSTSTVIFEG